MNIMILSGDLPINYNKLSDLILSMSKKYIPLRVATIGKSFIDKKI